MIPQRGYQTFVQRYTMQAENFTDYQWTLIFFKWQQSTETVSFSENILIREDHWQHFVINEAHVL